jgi:hypothetical protein
MDRQMDGWMDGWKDIISISNNNYNKNNIKIPYLES